MSRNCNLVPVNRNIRIFTECDGNSYDVTDRLALYVEHQSIRDQVKLVAPLDGSHGEILNVPQVHGSDGHDRAVLNRTGKSPHWRVLNSEKNSQWEITGQLSEKTFRISLSPAVTSSRSIFIVYFFNALICYPNIFIFRSQLCDLLKIGILDPVECADVSLHIVVTAKRDQVSDLMQIWRDLIEPTDICGCCSKFSSKLYFNFLEQFEYPGISKAWELARSRSKPSDLVLYFHGKGASHRGGFKRNERELFLFDCIVRKYRIILSLFDLFIDVSKIGFMTGGLGWMWYNFWWARADYLRTVEEPMITHDRHYYEEWLSHVEHSFAVHDSNGSANTECLSLISVPHQDIYNIGSTVDSSIASSWCGVLAKSFMLKKYPK